jgi:hypothetical protein
MKAIEGVSMLGPVNRANVTAYLHLDLNTVYIELLQAIGTDLAFALTSAKTLMQRVSPATCYGKLADVAMLAFQAYLGDTVAGPWNQDALKALGGKGEALLGYASRLASRPARPTQAMLLLDLASLHHVGGLVRAPTAVLQVQMAQVGPVAPVPEQDPVAVPVRVQPAAPVPVQPVAPVLARPVAVVQKESEKVASGGTVPERDQDWVVDPRLVNRRAGVSLPARSTQSPLLTPPEFSSLLGKHLIEQRLRSGRPTR